MYVVCVCVCVCVCVLVRLVFSVCASFFLNLSDAHSASSLAAAAKGCDGDDDIVVKQEPEWLTNFGALRAWVQLCALQLGFFDALTRSRPQV